MSIQRNEHTLVSYPQHKQSFSAVKKTFKNGLIVQEVEIGEGEEVTGYDTITIHYTGSIKDSGKVFDSTYKRSQPLTMTMGQGSVIKGFEQGLLGMRVGGIRKLLIPASIGFGDRNVAGIPCDSELEFEIELLDICEW